MKTTKWNYNRAIGHSRCHECDSDKALLPSNAQLIVNEIFGELNSKLGTNKVVRELQMKWNNKVQ